MRRRHVMPFGAALDADGVRFRLWAPEVSHAALEILPAGANRRRLPMPRDGNGWFEMRVEGVGAGCCYRFHIDDGIDVPDPVSRHQPQDVHGPSEVIDPEAYEWRVNGWRGRHWDEIVLYEMHVGAFTPEGTFAAAAERLPYLRDLGVTAVELMPVADFPGRRNWGYDGVLPFAPESRYGRPAALKHFVDAAHALGLAVLLDVVYNHFGPDGNYLYLYARRSFFSRRHATPWGAGINFDGDGSRIVRDYYIHNALYWLEEFQLDGLRFDAVHAICDDSKKHILTEIAEAVRAGPGRERHIHLVLENDDNAARYLERECGGFDAQWNDDAHHALHVILTGERDGYYADYRDAPGHHLGRALTEGFAYQGEHSPFRRRRRGEAS
ncbi:MAG TPA: alpha-amylase family glycosyl hydrolase, partial [Burkholderiales bacterium]|nr:alpha-amylase family glycosyl hydrolase [Burkholderiales bacterium]